MEHPRQYNAVLRIIHWLTTIVVVGLFAVGLWMVDLTYYSNWYKTAPYWHKSIGILLAALTVFRLIWRTLKGTPAIEGNRLEKAGAHAAHYLIYVLLFLIFISGYLISTSDGRAIDVFTWFSVPALGELFPNQSDIAGTIHYYAAFVLIGLAILHAAAALKHHFINKDNTLRKMLGDKSL
ncbi:cytochrome b [Grimontia hollisae]|uniref:Cytochrome b561 n=1 Tax=Grimontia hollisae CIP 101886 TaxID=675812 RepID=D0I5P1_GRIHO|nr:cytochrome b [Grimontia hollisae]AMG29186.1 cytochrome b [Grimontia hollisae]EEY73205.1 cytochrome b561 [Grimontia hollisae CIP 101886]MDF2184947.1 cytochrome b [Grimontia hollisae]STO76716.1 Cytochrome b561 homolog 2 [Grimontia hollisae]STQ76090.1 Cytochrome b561 homolog 2 [Grimontia hollisae]